MSRAFRYALVAAFALAGVALYLLATATANTERYTQNYSLLITLNAVIAGGMALVIGYLLWRLRARYRAKEFGTVLTARLVLMFALMAILPGTLVYTVSVQFLSRSIESWFNVKVDKSLESGLNLARATLDAMLQDVATRTRLMALDLADTPDSSITPLLNRMMDQTGLQEAAVFTTGGQLIAASGSRLVRIVPDPPKAEIMREAALGHGYAGVENVTRPDFKPDTGKAEERGGLRMRVVAPIAVRSLGAQPRFLQVLQNVPDQLTTSAESVQQGYRDYQELSLSREGLRRIFTITLTLTLLLALFGAIAAGFFISERMSAPLSLLAQGTAAVAAGDFTPRAEISSRDELGVLTQSFSRMTRQLDDARANVEQQQSQLESAKAYLENILANLTAGVLVFDANMRLATANQGAEAILGIDAHASQWKACAELPGLSEFARAVAEAFASHGDKTWQQQIEFKRPAAREGDEHRHVLLVRGSRLGVGDGLGYLVVCDDISELVSAQRSAAWGEVAQRLAHEIKNPLTPIQLSAERIQMKLLGRLTGSDAEVLTRGTEMIISQVDAMKRMVNDFRDYARTPPAVLQSIDLSALLHEILGLYENSQAPVKVDLAAGLPRVQGDPSQLRQVIHNLLQNAQDAVVGVPGPLVTVKTQAAGSGVLLTISDNGPGFAQKIIARAFEPYVTTKPRGTGLGLAIVKKIVEDHHGSIGLQNAPGGGAVVGITLIASTPEMAHPPSGPAAQITA
ncbi:MAG: signal transduction histidine kinase involved in nitrogen fixation and metabolism regulation [Betaproteobacteria bacterium]|nr:signal transduction histidine kinase involved in nitrogen fixation and metabolism regulation [Betaproteobacteria bacterium]